MKKTIKLSLLLITLMSMTSNKALAYDIAVKNEDGVTIYYNYINDGKELSVTYQGELNGYNPENNYTSESIVIPQELFYRGRTLEVTMIGSKAFWECENLKSVIIPNSVTFIKDNAFYCCRNLTSITIPKSVTHIGESAFYGCEGLTSVTILNSETSIGYSVFGYCTSLTSLPIPSSISYIAQFEFIHCTGLISVTIPNSIKTIMKGAFSQCSNLTTVTIPNSVTTISDIAFSGCNLTQVVSMIENPFAINGKKTSHYFSVFSIETFENATLYIPKGTMAKYRETEGWRDFINIVEMDDTDGIENYSRETITDNRYLNLNGQRIEGQPSQKGVYIKNGKKVLMK